MSKGFAGIGLGIFLFFVAFPVLFWNEGRAVKTARALAEGARSVIEIEATSVDNKHDKTLVHLRGQASTQETLQDPALGISINALKLKRTVEMYQWKQIGAGEDSSSNYDYRKEWSGTLLDSANYPINFQNPKSLPLASETFAAQEVSLGAFWLSSSLMNKLNTFQAVMLSEADLTSLETNLGLNGIHRQADYIYLPYGNGNSQQAAIGDVRITLEQMPTTLVSVIAQQNGSRLEPYTARSGSTIAIIKAGNHSAQEMFDTAVRENNALTTFLRIFGFGIMAGGIRLLFTPLTALTGFVPLLGSMIRFGAMVVATVLAFVLSLATAATAWFSYRPLIAIPLLVIAIASFYLARQSGKHRPAKDVPTA